MKASPLLIVILIWLIPFGLQAQDSSHVSINLGLSGSYQRGNFQRLQLINRVEGTLRTPSQKWELETRHLYLYQTVFGSRTQNDYLGRTFLTRELTDRLNVFTAFFYESYFIKRIQANIHAGLGVRYSIFRSEREFLELGLMGGYGRKAFKGNTFTDFDNGGSAIIQGPLLTPVWNSRFVLIRHRVILNLLAWMQQDLGLRQNWRTVIDGNLLFPITKGLSINLTVNYFYENLNLEGVQPSDLFFTYGIRYRFDR